ncbi:MAG: hypothetical protein ABW178_02435 [Pseudoxanthomonas sp.]
MVANFGFFSLVCALWLTSVCAASAQDCVAGFSTRGDADSGLHFETTAAVAGLDAGKAIAQFKQIGAGDGFQIGVENGGSDRRTLVLIQKPGANARGFDVNLAADQAQGQVRIWTDLPSGMSVSPEVMRGAMCGMVSRLDMARPIDVSSAPVTSAGLAAGAHGSPHAICELNFRSSIDRNVGRTYTSWAPFRGVGMAGGVERVQQLVQDAGFGIDPPFQHGTETELTIHTAGKDDPGSLPIHLVIEEGLGVISLSTRGERRQELKSDAMKGIFCTLVAAATATAIPNETSDKRSRFQDLFTSWRRQQKREREETERQVQRRVDSVREGLDQLMQQTLTSGKSVVIVPTLNLDGKYASDDLKDKEWEFRTDRTSTTIWRNLDDVGSMIRVGNDEGFEEIGLRGFVMSVTWEMKRYLVFIANPGTYTVVGSTYEAPTMQMPQLGSERQAGLSSLGQIALVPVKNTEYYQTQAWFNAQYSDRTQTDSYCTAALYGPGGPCVSWGSQSYNVKELTSPAGWRNVTESRSIDGLVLSTQLRTPVASFKVAPSEVVMVDGFFATPPNADFDRQACEADAGQRLRCDLTSVSFTRIPARVQDIAAFNPEAKGFPQTGRVLKQVKYRESTVAAKRGGFRGTLGQDYTVSVP